jgi:hypothetical protein
LLKQISYAHFLESALHPFQRLLFFIAHIHYHLFRLIVSDLSLLSKKRLCGGFVTWCSMLVMVSILRPNFTFVSSISRGSIQVEQAFQGLKSSKKMIQLKWLWNAWSIIWCFPLFWFLSSINILKMRNITFFARDWIMYNVYKNHGSDIPLKMKPNELIKKIN